MSKLWCWFNQDLHEEEFVDLVGRSGTIVRYLKLIGYEGDERWKRPTGVEDL